MNPDGSSKCMGFVCFASMEEAEKAVAEMNGKVLEARKGARVGARRSIFMGF